MSGCTDPLKKSVPTDPSATHAQHHLLISGAGRAGTSFLVRYLAGMGLETHLAIHKEGEWFEEANAGLEDLPISNPHMRLPYVVKSPWFCEFIDSVLQNSSILIDGVIIPVRDLAEAAASRVILELQSIHKLHPFMAELDHTWETWGNTPGGVVFSLNPTDQARLLAVWLYRLVERLTKADVPFVLLSFPRLIEDADYLFEKLRTFLPSDATVENARVVHERIADTTKVRVTRELRTNFSADASCCEHDELDGIAIRRELRTVKAALVQLQTRLESGNQKIINLQSQLAERERDLQNRIEEGNASCDALENARNILQGELTQTRTVLQSLTDNHDLLRTKLDAALAERDAIIRSRSWKLTAPLRKLRSKLSINRPGQTNIV
jgi:hypothetical protein